MDGPDKKSGLDEITVQAVMSDSGSAVLFTGKLGDKIIWSQCFPVEAIGGHSLDEICKMMKEHLKDESPRST